MKQRASWLNVLVNVEIITIPLVSFMLLGLCQLFNISIWYATSMLVLSIIDIAFDWHTMRISPKLLGTASILELRKKLVRQKKNECGRHAYPHRYSSYGQFFLSMQCSPTAIP